MQGVRVECASDSVHLQSADFPVVQQRRVATHGANYEEDRTDLRCCSWVVFSEHAATTSSSSQEGAQTVQKIVEIPQMHGFGG